MDRGAPVTVSEADHPEAPHYCPEEARGPDWAPGWRHITARWRWAGNVATTRGRHVFGAMGLPTADGRSDWSVAHQETLTTDVESGRPAHEPGGNPGDLQEGESGWKGRCRSAAPACCYWGSRARRMSKTCLVRRLVLFLRCRGTTRLRRHTARAAATEFGHVTNVGKSLGRAVSVVMIC